MAGIRFTRLVDDFVATLERAGATVIRPAAIQRERPAQFRVTFGNRSTDCLLFIWTITPGGGPPGVRPANERRIQMTNIAGMPLLPGVRTILSGWNVETGTYAFWDARRHTSFSSNSPSLQVSQLTLEQANQTGIASQLRPIKRDNIVVGDEVVIACEPRSLLWYVQNGGPLHNYHDDAAAIVDLVDAEPEEEREFIDTADTDIAAARRYDMVETMRAYRDAKFRPAVLQAYQHKCCVCQTDLKLVDAAHIVPVSHPTSTDEVTNGLALCRLHHGAYDNALLGIQSDYRIVINPAMVDRLNEIKLDTAIEPFTKALPAKIHVPASIEARPNPDNLVLGLQTRRWDDRFVA